MLKGNCRKKILTTCGRKISSYKPALRTPFLTEDFWWLLLPILTSNFSGKNLK